MATAKKADKATKKSTKADAAEVDDLLGSKKATKKAAKADDVLESKKAPKKSKKTPKKESSISTEDVRGAILKCRKLTSYADVAASLGSEDMRQVRRTARTMRDAGEIEIVKEGTVCFVKKK